MLQLLRLVGPQLAVVALFIGYLLLGTLGFQLLDEQLARESFSEIVLFCFETLATIGKAAAKKEFIQTILVF